MKRSFYHILNDSDVEFDVSEPPYKRSNTNILKISFFDNEIDNSTCLEIYQTLVWFPWVNIYSFDIPTDISKIIAIYATGNIFHCQDINCNKPTSETFLLNSFYLNEEESSKLKICGNRKCNEYLTCCKRTTDCIGCTSGLNRDEERYFCVKCLNYQKCDECGIGQLCCSWKQCKICKIFMCHDCAKVNGRKGKDDDYFCEECYYNPYS